MATEPEGYVRIFDQGPSLTRLLAEAAHRGIKRDYVARLLAAIGAPTTTRTLSTAPAETITWTAPSPPSPSLKKVVEPLSERELEVLHLIAAGLSNAQIAAQLYVEVSTVKRHINHIFAKLGVTTRTQALARGRSLDLLP